MNCIAIDLHTDNFTAARRRIVKEKAVKTTVKFGLDDKSLKSFINTLSKEDFVAVESTLNSFWFYDMIKPHVKKVIIFDTHKISFNGNKTDKIDAKKLLETLEYFVFIKGGNELPEVYVPEKQIREMRELFSTYSLEKKMSVQVKNRIHSIFKQHGKKLSRKSMDSLQGKEKVRNLEINNLSKYQVSMLLDQVIEIETRLEKITGIIIEYANRYFRKELDNLITIPGVSPLLAAALLADIADISRFSNVKKFCSYLRTAPRIKESNKKTYLGKVNKDSRSLTVTLFTQSILHFRNSAAYFDEFYLRLKEGKSYGKCRMALIRKILVCCYYMLKMFTNFLSIEIK